jgi:hypothetical protein
MEIDPVFREKCHEVPNSRLGDRRLLELDASGLRYWVSSTAEKILEGGSKKPRNDLANRIRQKQSPSYADLYTLMPYDLEPR